jgi:hypothetical protein
VWNSTGVTSRQGSRTQLSSITNRPMSAPLHHRKVAKIANAPMPKVIG